MSRATLSLAVVVGACLLSGPAAQTGKKIFISVDMEGISGIADDQLSAGRPEYARSRKLMVEDTNAAIRGALSGGATEVVVNDSHGSMRNLLIEDLHPSARLISHSFKRDGMMEGLDDSFDGVIFVGYHAKAENGAGLFAHTGTGAVRDLRINGTSVGEGGMNTMLAAWYGVPVLVVTGDDVAVAQVKEVATSARGVVVKRAINMRAAELKPLDQAHKEIEQASREAVAAARRGAPQRQASYKVELRFRDVVVPYVAESLPGISRPAPDTLAFTSDSMQAAYRLIRVLYRYLSVD